MKIRSAIFWTLPALISLCFIAATSLNAQIPIKLPKLPKIFREKPAEEPAAKATPTESAPKVTGMGSETSAAPEPKRAEVQAAVNSCDGGRESVHLEDLGKTKQEALGFVPGKREYYVSTLSHSKNIYLEAALLPGVRKQWFSDQDDKFIKCLTPALDELAAVARKTLPSYTGPTGYTFGTAVDKRTLTGTVTDIAKAQVLMVGMKQANWIIAKDNFNFPTARYKHGVVVAKYPDTEFCWLFWINLVQDYAGGGTYGASYGNYVGRSLSGCPVGK